MNSKGGWRDGLSNKTRYRCHPYQLLFSDMSDAASCLQPVYRHSEQRFSNTLALDYSHQRNGYDYLPTLITSVLNEIIEII